MSNINSLSDSSSRTKQVAGDHQNSGNNLLNQLEDRVNNTLKLENNNNNSVGKSQVNAIDTAMIKDYIAGISNQPQAGMSVSFEI